MHRLVGEAEHGVEQKMLDQADRLPDPETMREGARMISRNADRHLPQARRLTGDNHSDSDPRPAQAPDVGGK
jgi:hypothetical protein